MFKRPKTEKERQRREATGLIRASRFVRRYASSHKKITIDTICAVHNEIFFDSWPEIAGKYREENLEIKGSKHLPPHYSRVAERMEKAGLMFRKKLDLLDGCEGFLQDSSGEEAEIIERIDRIVGAAAWIHHLITFIHPFREGNGRTARLSANLVLERFGLMGISPKIENKDEERYCNALAQIDTQDDYAPLKNLIGEGLVERYNGVKIKYYSEKK